jgi:hypothetical protein
MSLKLLDRWARTLTFQLNVWYLLTFTASVIILYFFLYLLISRAVERKDREVIESRLKEYATVYRAGGPSALQRVVAQEGQRQKSFYVRLLNPFNTSSSSFVPEDWIEFEPPATDAVGIQRQVGWIRIPARRPTRFHHWRHPAFDGSVLEVGRSTNNHEMLLEPFRTASSPSSRRSSSSVWSAVRSLPGAPRALCARLSPPPNPSSAPAISTPASRRANPTTNSMNSPGYSTRCSTKTSRSFAACANHSTTSRTTCARP